MSKTLDDTFKDKTPQEWVEPVAVTEAKLAIKVRIRFNILHLNVCVVLSLLALLWDESMLKSCGRIPPAVSSQ